MATSVSPLTRSAPRRTGTAAAGLLTDGALARLVARGDDGAFEALYRRYERELYRYCRGITRHDEDAEEAFQHTMLNAYRALTKGGRDRDLAVRPWLYRIAHNESVSLLRGRRTSEELDERDDPVAGDLHERVEQRESLRELGRDLQSLSHRQRSALLLREMAGLSHEAVGEALETTPADARHLLHEARASLYEFRAGRDMACKEVERQILGGDRRQLRSRRVRAHLAGCETCRDLSAAQVDRRRRIAAFDPVLPAGLAASVLGRVLGGSGASGAAGAAGAAGLAGSGVGSATSGLLGGIGTTALGGVAVVTMVAVTIGGLTGVDVGGASNPITPAGATAAATGTSTDSARISSGPLARLAPPAAAAAPAAVADRAAAAADEPAGLPDLLTGSELPAPALTAAGAPAAAPRPAVTPAVPPLPVTAPTTAPQVAAAAAGAVTVPDASDLVPPAIADPRPPVDPTAPPSVEPPVVVERPKPKPPKPAPPQSQRPVAPAGPAAPSRPVTPARPAVPDPAPARPAPPAAAPELPVGPPAGVPGLGPPPAIAPPGPPDAPPGSRGRGRGQADPATP